MAKGVEISKNKNSGINRIPDTLSIYEVKYDKKIVLSKEYLDDLEKVQLEYSNENKASKKIQLEQDHVKLAELIKMHLE